MKHKNTHKHIEKPLGRGEKRSEERFERQAAALRDNLRRRNKQKSYQTITKKNDEKAEDNAA